MLGRLCIVTCRVSLRSWTRRSRSSRLARLQIVAAGAQIAQLLGFHHIFAGRDLFLQHR